MRKILLIILMLTVIAAIAFFAFAPRYFDSTNNILDGKLLEPVSEEATALHKTLTIVDLHSDSLLWQRDVLGDNNYGHMDLPRLQQGNVALQVFSSVTKTPTGQNYDNNNSDGDNVTLLVIGQLQPVRTWTSLLERSLWHATKRDRTVEESGGVFAAVNNGTDVTSLLADRSAGSTDRTGALLSIEGLHNLEGKTESLDVLYDAGFRMAGLTHFFDNELAGSMHGEEKGGLTPFGRDIVRRMEEKGMIVDIAHLSKKATAEVLAMATRPLVSSHGGVQATCDVNRNLTDDEIAGLAKTGGVIGVGYWEGAICDTSPKAIVAAMKHIRDLVGIEHVALGSDYDGTITARFDTSGLVHITNALLEEGFTEEEIRAIMGENAIRVISEGLKPASELANAQSIEDIAE
ncbi:dipeptidase [Pontixanthobacter aestiaquae]|uniref:Peptidase M19 n=1 Tax=Pontixanthobacter aestiaquae TaxID=1509367 RepID=A0A844Z4K3_9SPHN|nr:dipeptidase [Pontixanthobacter aestiaquae]MDN3646992.1 dipeptidase [Pontixanthobacter aestiaquae]MXO82027.1 peptidase M19 [Pontixanthobacter aestiaquae]